jgi:hypothetical protein
MSDNSNSSNPAYTANDWLTTEEAAAYLGYTSVGSIKYYIYHKNPDKRLNPDKRQSKGIWFKVSTLDRFKETLQPFHRPKGSKDKQPRKARGSKHSKGTLSHA